MKWPEIVELNDVTIAPMHPRAFPGDLRLPVSVPSPVLHHFRFGHSESALKFVPVTDDDLERARTVEKPHIFGGLLFHHFGHSIAESMHRLWPRFAQKGLRGAKVVFSPVRTMIEPYHVEAWKLHGIDEEKVLRLRKPMRFRRLIVGAQARQMGGPTFIPGYQTMLDPLLDERLPSARRDRCLYLCRLDYLRSGSFYGEGAVARELVSQGFELIYPERHSLTDLVAMLREARTAIFAEGSAVHALELCGSHVPEVVMISRRHNSQKRFEKLLANICRRWLISDHLICTAGLADFEKKHSGVVDLAAVMRDIQQFLGVSGTKWFDRAWAAQAMMEDCERLIGLMEEPGNESYPRRASELKARISAVAASV